MSNDNAFIYLYSSGFAFLKRQSSSKYLYENYFNAPFTTLHRELVSFFDNQLQSEFTIVVNANSPLLVPQEYFTEPASSYLKTQFNLSDNDLILQDAIENYIALYYFPNNRMIPIHQSNILHRFQHVDTMLYRYLQNNQTDFSNRILLFFHENKVDYICIKDDKLSIINRLQYTSEHDILYFVLNLTRRQQINADEYICLLSGHTPEIQKIYKLLSQYISNVEWAAEELDIEVTNSTGRKILSYECLNLLPF